jgi:hypothetical protein
MACPGGMYAPPGSTQAGDCEACAAGQYDHTECDWVSNMVFEKMGPDGPGGVPWVPLCVSLQVPVAPCFQALGYARDEAECIQWAYERAPLGSVLDMRSTVFAGGYACHVGFGEIALQPAFNNKACRLKRDPGTPCVPCQAGRFSTSTTACTACPADVGNYAARGSDSIDDCTICAAGEVDADSSARTPCQKCPVGTYAQRAGLQADRGHRVGRVRAVRQPPAAGAAVE